MIAVLNTSINPKQSNGRHCVVVCTHTDVHVLYTSVRKHKQTSIHTCMDAYIHHTHACVHVPVYAHVHTHAWMNACTTQMHTHAHQTHNDACVHTHEPIQKHRYAYSCDNALGICHGMTWQVISQYTLLYDI